jgi:hypothetical protein
MPCDMGHLHPRCAPLVFSPSREHAHTKAKLCSTFFFYRPFSSRFSLQPEAFSPCSPFHHLFTSCRSKLEFGLSSPHHQPDKYVDIKSHYPILKLTLAVFSCKLLQDRLYSPPFFSSSFALRRKGRSFCVLPPQISGAMPFICLAVVWNSMRGWASTNWQAGPFPFHSCKRPPFLDLRLPLPGTLWLESGLVLNYAPYQLLDDAYILFYLTIAWLVSSWTGCLLLGLLTAYKAVLLLGDCYFWHLCLLSDLQGKQPPLPRKI